MIRTAPRLIRKRPRRLHRFVPILHMQQMSCAESRYCEECIDNFAAQAEHLRPGHAWTVDGGKVIFMEDVIAASILGRPLAEDEVVVHKDGNVLNNVRANLEVVKIPDLGIQ